MIAEPYSELGFLPSNFLTVRLVLCHCSVLTKTFSGNSSSATIISVMDRLRQKDMDDLAPGGKVKDFVVGCAFGPGIAIEMCMLKRNLNHVRRTLVATGNITPPETESEGSRSEGELEPEDLEAEIEAVKLQDKTLSEKAATVHPEVPEQGESLSDALGGVELD